MQKHRSTTLVGNNIDFVLSVEVMNICAVLGTNIIAISSWTWLYFCVGIFIYTTELIIVHVNKLCYKNYCQRYRYRYVFCKDIDMDINIDVDIEKGDNIFVDVLCVM